MFGLGLFLVSAIIALFSIYSSKLPKNFDKVTGLIKNYEVYQLDSKSNFVQWILKAKEGISNSSQTSVKVSEVDVKVFEGSEIKYIITSNKALAREFTETLELMDNVTVRDPKGEFELDAGRLQFNKDLSLLVNDNWKLKTKNNYEMTGTQGTINKGFDSIVSTGKASLRKDDLNLKADKIIYKSKDPIKAIGNSILEIELGKQLKADNITINTDGTVKAKGNVEIKTVGANCFGRELSIEKDKVTGDPLYAHLTGSPYAIQNGKMIKANIIIYDFKQNIINAQGNVHTQDI